MDNVFEKLCLWIILIVTVCTCLSCRNEQSERIIELQGNKEGLIAFSRLTEDYWQIWTIRSDGSEQRQVTTSLFDKRYPVWSPTGDELFFRTNNSQAFKVNIYSGEEEGILEDMGLVGGPIPSPNGDKLVFTRYRTQIKDSGNLWTALSNGEHGKLLTREAGIQYDPDWSKDGRQVLYVSGEGYRTSEIYIIDIVNRNTSRLTNNRDREAVPVFSPDSKKLAYSADTTGNYEIWIMNTDGSNRVQLTDTKGIDTRPSWSPDGKQIVFTSNRSGSLQLWLIDSDGSNPKQLTFRSQSIDPCWRGNNAR